MMNILNSLTPWLLSYPTLTSLFRLLRPALYCTLHATRCLFRLQARRHRVPRHHQQHSPTNTHATVVSASATHLLARYVIHLLALAIYIYRLTAKYPQWMPTTMVFHLSRSSSVTHHTVCSFVCLFVCRYPGGILPFGACFVELFFIMSSIWMDQVSDSNIMPPFS